MSDKPTIASTAPITEREDTKPLAEAVGGVEVGLVGEAGSVESGSDTGSDLVAIANDPRHIKKAAFLKAYRECGNISEASRAVGISRARHYAWVKVSPEYVEAFNHATDDAIDELEQVARSRAKKGSDLLLIFLLRALRPSMYREKVEHTGKDGGPITIEHLAPMREPTA